MDIDATDDPRVTTPRAYWEALEAHWLAPRAARGAASRGRQRPEPPCPYRTAYQRDRDRILHSKAFRRLADKTQVFVAPRSDHHRNRLTHTLEVCQVARTIARALRLNEDLTEAIALGHDLGHSPFGHSGEAALDAVYRQYDPDAGFHHSEHSLRIVDVLERDGEGLNLTWEVRDGIVRHSKGDVDWSAVSARAATLEGQLVAFCDRIAYCSHDMDDAIRVGVIAPDHVPDAIVRRLGATHSARLTALVADVIACSRDLTTIRLSAEMEAITDALKDFMYARVYARSMTARRRARIGRIITELFHHGMACPASVPGLDTAAPTPARARAVCDYIAGMTDHFAERQHAMVSRQG